MSIEQAMQQAVEAAREWVGATSPNPPVGAAALDPAGRVLSVQAHRKAGTPHAEALVLSDLADRGLTDALHTMVVTLEPCNHQGRTPPCTAALLKAPSLKKVVFGLKDVNRKVPGGGAEALRARGLVVLEHPTKEARDLVEPFSHWARTGKPWIVLKQALTRDGSMLPPPGQKTFTSEESLLLAHRLRRESDAIITGSGTILADDPLFTVRKLADHPGKKRWVALLDRRKRVPESWLETARARGLEPLRAGSIGEALSELGSRGCLQALVEAGPSLSQAFLDGCLWNRHVVVQQGRPGTPDQVRDLRAAD